MPTKVAMTQPPPPPPPKKKKKKKHVIGTSGLPVSRLARGTGGEGGVILPSPPQRFRGRLLGSTFVVLMFYKYLQ